MTREWEKSPFAKTPAPPYYAVIFASLRRQRDEGDDGYADMAERMAALALRQPGCLGAESARNADGFGLTVSYFATEADILAWKRHAEHVLAQSLGQTRWYEHYEVRIAKVERAYSGPQGRDMVSPQAVKD
ncbi:antibiotic biosynthesis monooxygenase [Rhodoblastus sp. 17X3]|uniref:antibiotic biosynthesis monooxygenase family protein n=1 Tax=Rhodoblastus sp. 17X3 TaxID=3047026 RepID=UPI0024B63C04|nr:antibiotic biosynthesis monooxygenase [Rhodoblastus sp. 17X3]MDI9848073.1 antibiotic biosynthesis monooxygenase [Rhodoblastus sp. 17X3]